MTPAPLTIRADDASKVYGQTFTPLGTAFTTPVAPQNGETIGSVTVASPAGTPATASVAGPYAITPSNASGGTFTPSNYTITYVDGALTVTPAPLTIRADDASKVYGQTFTPLGTAFTTPVAQQNGEIVGSVTMASPAGTQATDAAAGSYAITPSNASGGTFTPSNYTITYVDGVLTVTPGPVPVPVIPVPPAPGTAPLMVPRFVDMPPTPTLLLPPAIIVAAPPQPPDMVLVVTEPLIPVAAAPEKAAERAPEPPPAAAPAAHAPSVAPTRAPKAPRN